MGYFCVCLIMLQYGRAAGRKKKGRQAQAWQLPPGVLETLEAFLMEPAQLAAEHAALDALEAATAGDPTPMLNPIATLSDAAEAASVAGSSSPGRDSGSRDPSGRGLAQDGAAVQNVGVLDARGAAGRAWSRGGAAAEGRAAGAPAAGLPSDQLSEGVPIILIYLTAVIDQCLRL